MDELMTGPGAVSFETYKKYSRFAGSILWLPAISVLLVLAQAANGDVSSIMLRAHIHVSIIAVANNLFLSFWTGDTLGLTQGQYMAIYGALGAAVAIFSFLVSYAFR
jgi:ATP-binding cassette subfamily C (CFTR/MRP) protein 1